MVGVEAKATESEIQKCFEKWKEHLMECVESVGSYIEGEHRYLNIKSEKTKLQCQFSYCFVNLRTCILH